MHSREAQIDENLFFRMFPPPEYLRMPSFGVDISDHSVRFIGLGEKRGKKFLKRFGQRNIPDGALSYGDIKDRKTLAEILKELVQTEHLSFIRCSLPEEKAYLFKTDVPILNAEETRDNIAFQLEENVPIKVADAVFDYVFLPPHEEEGQSREAVVSVFPKAMVDSYLSLYKEAGMTVLSFEMEACPIARALVAKKDPSCYMIVDFGRQRTGLSIVERGVVQFASTVDVGGNILTGAIQKQFNVSFDEAEQIKHEGTFVGHGVHREFFSTLMNSISALSDEINKHYVYWHTHPDKKGRKPTPIRKIILCGGDVNLSGLVEHLSLILKTRVELGNVWLNILSLDQELPAMPFSTSLSYAAAIGLSLRGL
jgi:type IV pilus assembly protein PilM